MKKLLFLSLVAISVFIFACVKDQQIGVEEVHGDLNLLNRSSESGIGQACEFVYPSSGSCFPGVATLLIELPNYPGCTFFTTVDYVFCWGLGATSIHLSGFVINDHDCPQYNADLLAAIAAGTEESFIINFNSSVWKEITHHFLNSSVEATVVEIEYIIMACNRMCYVEQSTGGPFTALIPVEEACSDACCRRRLTYRRDGKDWTSDIHIVERHGDSCEPLAGTCSGQGINVTDCIDMCETLVWQ